MLVKHHYNHARSSSFFAVHLPPYLILEFINYNYVVCIVTNQMGVGKYFTFEELEFKIKNILTLILAYCSSKLNVNLMQSSLIAANVSTKDDYFRKPKIGSIFTILKRREKKKNLIIDLKIFSRIFSYLSLLHINN
jgi:histidinol phosphatase-like enzyme